MKVLKSCLSCNKIFDSYASQKKQFCSRDCLYEFNKTEEGLQAKSAKIQNTKKSKGTSGKEERECKQCKNTFTALKSETKSFCSKSCRYEYIASNKDLMLEKQYKTNEERYGYRFPTQNKNISESIRKTASERYGSSHPRFSDEAVKKRLETCISKYGKPYAPSFCNQSKDEMELVEYIKSILPTQFIEENNRTLLKGKEVDVYIPSKQIAIEYNGLYYHSELKIAERKYHLNKTKSLEKLGVRLIHIFSDEWCNKKDIVKKKIQNILTRDDKRLYARECVVRAVSPKDANLFLELNHIQGGDKSKHKLGLYYGKELVALMTFSVGRSMMGALREDNKWELSRFATKCRVVGGASKLLHHFIKNYKPTKIISYADRRWSVGNLYEQLGFINVGFSAPSYWYTKDYRNRLYRYNFRKSMLLKLGADPNKTEWQIMQELGYDRIWDCGTIRYELTLNY